MKLMKTTVVFAAVAAVALGAEALEISKVPEGKLCALSFTYDDGVATHFTHALPMHLKYGMPGTFLIVTDRVEADGAERAHKCCSWAELREMSGKGMEIASHTKSHRNMREIESAGVTREMTQGKKRDEIFALREKNWPELLEEVKGSKEAIEAHCGNSVRTYAFAGNACPDWSGRLMGEVGGCIRAGNIRIATGRGDTEEKYRKQFEEKILVTNRVGCVMIHGLGTKTPDDGWNPIPDLETYESLFKIVKEHGDKIHFDTFGNNAFYEMRANGVRRQVRETAKREARAAIRRHLKQEAQEAAMDATAETVEAADDPNQVMPEGPLSAEDEEIVEVADEAVSDKDFETAQDVAAEALKSSDARVRVQAVETLMGFGETALPELADFLNDPHHEVAVLAADRYELAVQEIEDDAERVAVAKLGVLSIDDPDELLAMMGTLRMSTDETAVLTALADIIRDGSAAQAAVAREAYREETGDEWTTPEAARAWLVENDYPVPENQ